MLLAVALAGAAVSAPARRPTRALGDAEQMLHRSSGDAARCPRASRPLHTRFGTPARAVDVTVVAMILVVLASGGRVAWLARAYAIAIAVMLVLTIASLARLRRTRQGHDAIQGARQRALGGPRAAVGLLASGMSSP